MSKETSRKDFYLKFNVNDFRTDPKLCECNAMAHGVYIQIMCLLFNTEVRGKFKLHADCMGKFAELLLKQNDQQSNNQTKEQIENICSCIAPYLAKHLPFYEKEVCAGLTELLINNVLYLEDGHLCQKRMVKDGEISAMRALNGKKGGTETKKRTIYPPKKKTNQVKLLLKQNDQQSSQQKPNYNYISIYYYSLEEIEGLLRNTGGGTGENGFWGERELRILLPDGKKPCDMNKLYEVNEFIDIYFSSPKYSFVREQVAGGNYMDLKTLRLWAEAFNRYITQAADSLDETGATVKYEQDWARHFMSWLVKMDKKEDPKKLPNNKGDKPEKAKKKTSMPGVGASEEEIADYYK